MMTTKSIKRSAGDDVIVYLKLVVVKSMSLSFHVVFPHIMGKTFMSLCGNDN